MRKTKKIILTAMLLALLIVLSRFLSIKTPLMKISFAFIPTMLCATWLGPKWTMLLNLLGDLIGATLFPTGAFFIGYTISTVVAGFIYGVCLYQRTVDTFSRTQLVVRAIIAVLLVTLVVNMGLNTLWTSITVGQAFWPLLGTRIVKQLIMVPIHVVVFLALEKVLQQPFNKYLRDDSDADDGILPLEREAEQAE